MTRDRTQEQHPEDTAILQALRAMDAVDADSLRTLVRTGDETDDALLRRYSEVLGLLGYAAEPVPASEELKSRILGALTGDETQRIDPVVMPASPRPSGSSRPNRSRRPAPAPRVSRAAYWLAAMLAVVALGLAGGILWFSQEIEAQRERFAAQERLLDELEEALEAANAEQRALIEAGTALQDVRERFRLVTAAGTELCPMRPPERSPRPDARGVLYIAADHQHWYLKAEGLEPPDRPLVYHLWFVAGPDKEPVSGGTFRAVETGEVHLESPTMPEGTTAAVITLEHPDGGDRPSGPVVLYGDEVMRIL